MDLVEHLEMWRFWLDDPIQHLLADPRRLRIRARDDLHLRVVDVVALLGARRYAREDALVIEVRDAACPDVAGRYRLDGGLEAAAAARTDASADIVLDAAALARCCWATSAWRPCTAQASSRRHGGRRAPASSMFTWSPRPSLNQLF